MRLRLLAGITLTICALAYADQNSKSKTTTVAEIDGYRNWVKINPRVLQIDFSLLDCTGRRTKPFSPPATTSVSPSPVKQEDSPHGYRYTNVYIKAIGTEVLFDKIQEKFPEGTTIVKEKLPAENSKTPELLAVMIKHRHGYDPEHGDWEYLLTDGEGTKVQQRGKLAECQSCHEAIKGIDYVHRTYGRPLVASTPAPPIPIPAK